MDITTRHPHLVANLASVLDRSPFAHHGIRRVDDAADAVVGAVLAPSRRWDDGAPTADLLPGTSALGYHDAVTAATAVRLAGDYSGRYLLLLGSDAAADAAGEDHREVVLKSARVLAVLDLGA